MKVFLPLVLCFAACAAQAQMPTDNPVWKGRCDRLSQMLDGLGRAAPAPALVAATRGIPGDQYTIVAFDRSSAKNHWVACTMFYMAAVAEANGNGGKVRRLAEKNRIILAEAERRMALGQAITAREELRRAGVEARDVTAATPTPAQVGAVIAAADVLPAQP